MNEWMDGWVGEQVMQACTCKCFGDAQALAPTDKNEFKGIPLRQMLWIKVPGVDHDTQGVDQGIGGRSRYPGGGSRYPGCERPTHHSRAVWMQPHSVLSANLCL